MPSVNTDTRNAVRRLLRHGNCESAFVQLDDSHLQAAVLLIAIVYVITTVYSVLPQSVMTVLPDGAHTPTTEEEEDYCALEGCQCGAEMGVTARAVSSECSAYANSRLPLIVHNNSMAHIVRIWATARGLLSAQL